MKKLFCVYMVGCFVFSGLYAMKNEENDSSKKSFGEKIKVCDVSDQKVQPSRSANYNEDVNRLQNIEKNEDTGEAHQQNPDANSPGEQISLDDIENALNENAVTKENVSQSYDSTCFYVTKGFLSVNVEEPLMLMIPEHIQHPAQLFLEQMGVLEPKNKIVVRWDILEFFLPVTPKPARRLFFAYTNVATYLPADFFPPDSILNILKMSKKDWSDSVQYRATLPMKLKEANATPESIRHWMLCMLCNSDPNIPESSEILRDGLEWDDTFLDRLSEHKFMIKSLTNEDVVKILTVIPMEYRYLAALFITKEFFRMDNISFVFNGTTDGNIDEESVQQLKYNEIVMLLNEPERAYLPNWRCLSQK